MKIYIRNLLAFLKDSWIIIGISLTILFLIEISLNSYYNLKDKRDIDIYIKDAINLNPYNDIDLTKNYFIEAFETNVWQWRPYTYVKNKAHSGKYINIDKDGNRKTWNPSDTKMNDSPKLKIWVFGGSTTWGSGSRDEFTIPSIIGKILHEKGANPIVSNFGIGSYASTQEVIRLILELQKGNRPDLVIFYDGVNDSMAAYMLKAAGLHQWEDNIEKLFNMYNNNRARFLYESTVLDSSTLRFMKDNIIQPQQEINSATNILTLADKASEQSLAHETIRVYKENMKIVNALSKEHSFKAMFYWQPVIFEKSYLTKFEEQQASSYRAAESLFKRIYKSLRESDIEEISPLIFRDISKIFYNTKDNIFLDYCHITENANRLVAEKISKDILEIISSPSQ